MVRACLRWGRHGAQDWRTGVNGAAPIKRNRQSVTLVVECSSLFFFGDGAVGQNPIRKAWRGILYRINIQTFDAL